MLSSDVLKHRQSRSPFTAQRRAVAAGTMDPRHQKVLDLQRQAGNRAVSSMLGAPRRPAVQRELTYRASDLRPHQRAMSGTYAKLVKVVRDFHATSDVPTRITLAGTIRGLCDTWLGDHAVPAGGKPLIKTSLFGAGRTDAQRTLVTRLRAEAGREYEKLKKDAAYLSKMRSGGFKAMAETTKLAVDAPSRALASGGTMDMPYTGANAKALEVIQKYKLTEAEIAAVRVFTVSDYTYINPAKAGADSWLKSNILRAKDPRFKEAVGPRPFTNADPWSHLGTVKQEGQEHAAMLMEALVKLPPYNQVTYRGTRMTPEDFAVKCRQGAEFPFSSFASSAKRREIAQGFADGKGGDVAPAKEAVVSVVFVVNMKNGRDISKISAATKPEDEVTILPGTVYVVDRVVRMQKGNPGTPTAQHWYTVFLNQAR
ncbi:MAG TPA: hypothetical protein VFI15_00230 [Candidatus Limnocylindrales bacterium]|nr:hypothetical protein [Candidatus Limnocylindrales bacterium]